MKNKLRNTPMAEFYRKFNELQRDYVETVGDDQAHTEMEMFIADLAMNHEDDIWENERELDVTHEYELYKAIGKAVSTYENAERNDDRKGADVFKEVLCEVDNLHAWLFWRFDKEFSAIKDQEQS